MKKYFKIILSVMFILVAFISCKQQNDVDEEIEKLNKYYTVTYNGIPLMNSETGNYESTVYPNSVQVKYGTFLNENYLPVLTWEKDDDNICTFESWSIEKNGENCNAYMYEVKNNIILFANWKIEKKKEATTYDSYLIMGEEEILIGENMNDEVKPIECPYVNKDVVYFYDSKTYDDNYFKSKKVYKTGVNERKRDTKIYNGLGSICEWNYNYDVDIHENNIVVRVQSNSEEYIKKFPNLYRYELYGDFDLEHIKEDGNTDYMLKELVEYNIDLRTDDEKSLDILKFKGDDKYYLSRKLDNRTYYLLKDKSKIKLHYRYE